VAIIQSYLRIPRCPNVRNIHRLLDSVFHHTLPKHVSAYAIDQKIAREKGLRKYEFHEISYSYILRSASAFLHKPASETSLIALHLGSGASACAIKNGTSVDTTMGLTPVCGLSGGSRSGDIDPSLIFHYTSDASKLSPSSTKDLHISTAEDILNKQSGWKALAGTTDFSKIASPHATEGGKLALEIFVDRIAGYVGNYFVKLNGEVDALVFAGGIGEKSAMLRQRVVEQCQCLGFEIEDGKNEQPGDGGVVEIGSGRKARTLICQTDEQVSRLAL
jgi:acetate kinase